MSSKLHLKRTPAEQAAHDFRKAQRAARKAAKKRRRDSDDERTDTKRRDTSDYVFGFSDEEYGPPPPPDASASSSRAHKPDYDEIYAQLEEQRFREKIFEALGDDERLDGLTSNLNGFGHVPRRWRGGGMDRMDDELGMDPNVMEDEDYAEWVRAGMWRKKHAAEYEEQQRREAERAARKKREEALREETKRMQTKDEEERRRRRKGKERQHEAEARTAYDARWKQLLSASESLEELAFRDVPWPVFSSAEVKVDGLTVEAISTFLLPTSGDSDEEAGRKERRDKLRETMLRFHPDKFEGRILSRVREKDRVRVKEAVGVVARILGELMGGLK